jgi:dolichol kinase
MNKEERLRIFMVPLWLLILSIPLLLISILMLISSIIIHIYEKMVNKDLSNLGIQLERKKETWSKAKRDTHRKLNHVLIFLGLILVWYVGLFIAQDYTGSSAGMIPDENNMLLLYSRLLTNSNSIFEVLFSLGWFYYILFFFFYIFSLFLLANEFARKSQYISFPFTFFTKIYLSDKEKENYGSYLFFAIGQMFTAFTCPPMVFFTILGIGSISDLMTSQIGIRYGKTHITWNKNKTWEGTIAGILTTLVISFLFVGLYWALIFALAFLVFDILTDKPINISDNLLIPIGCSLLFLFIRFFLNLDYYTIIIFWI